MASKAAQQTQEKLTRIAIVNEDRCKPKKCRQECKRSCPVVRMGESVWFSLKFATKYWGNQWIFIKNILKLVCFCLGKLCIEVTPADKIAFISEDLCIGCGICTKVRCVSVYLLIFIIDESYLTISSWTKVSQSFLCRNAPLKRYRLLICRVTWNRTLRIATAQIPSNCTDCRCQDLVKCLDWSELTVLAKARRWKYWQANWSPTWVVLA